MSLFNLVPSYRFLEIFREKVDNLVIHVIIIVVWGAHVVICVYWMVWVEGRMVVSI